MKFQGDRNRGVPEWARESFQQSRGGVTCIEKGSWQYQCVATAKTHANVMLSAIRSGKADAAAVYAKHAAHAYGFVERLYSPHIDAETAHWAKEFLAVYDNPQD